MISRINLLKRKEGLTAEEFAAYLTQAHGELLATMPFLKGCETNVVVDNEQRSPFDRGSTEIDGYTEMFFDSYGDMVRGMAALEEALATDYAQFAAPGIPALVAVKKVDTPVPAYLDDVKLIKRMSFLGRKDGVSAAVFQDEWWQMHSALVKTMTGYAGYNQNLVIDRIVDGESVPFEELPIEGVVEFWFENMKALVVDSAPASLEIAEYTIDNGFVRNLYQVSDFATARFLIVPTGESTLAFAHEGGGEIEAFVEVSALATSI